MATRRSTFDVHVGEKPPDYWDEIEQIRATANPFALGTKRRPRITGESIDWQALGLTPRWVGDDSSEAVAALEPSRFHNNGAQEWVRFIAGTKRRGELALAISTLNPRPEGTPVSLGRGGAGVTLPGSDSTHIGGSEINLVSPPELAAGLSRADRDLALRFRNRPLELPWWALDMDGLTDLRPGSTTHWEPEGESSPLLISTAGEVVAAVWTSPDGAIRHYVLPFLPSYVPILEWIVDQAVPEYVPTAARRVRGTLSNEPALLTAAEAEARSALEDFETEADRHGRALRETLERATAEADEVRDPMLYASGPALVAAVGRVLEDAGLGVIDLDEFLEDTANADLLVTLDGRRMLVEVKGSSGNPSERLVDDPVRHLRTWPEVRPDLPVEGVVFVLNHQANIHPLDRSPEPFTRSEFVATLTIPILTTRQLFDWWRAGNFEQIRSAIFGEDSQPTEALDDEGAEVSGSADAEHPEEAADRGSTRSGFLRRRRQGRSTDDA